jgi:hypothetical protein
MNTITIPGISPWILALIVLWTIPWKGIALWKAARLSHKWWFVVLLVLNTVGILEIIYIFLIARKYSVETERPDADVDRPSADVAGSLEPSISDSVPSISSISQTIKTTEVKTTMTSPEKELPKIEEKKNMAEKTKSESVSELEK